MIIQIGFFLKSFFVQNDVQNENEKNMRHIWYAERKRAIYTTNSRGANTTGRYFSSIKSGRTSFNSTVEKTTLPQSQGRQNTGNRLPPQIDKTLRIVTRPNYMNRMVDPAGILFNQNGDKSTVVDTSDRIQINKALPNRRLRMASRQGCCRTKIDNSKLR